MAITITLDRGGYQEISGLSTDTKPTNCSTGSVFVETDTGSVFLFDSEGGEWIEQFSLQNGGGSGLPAYSSSDIGKVLTVGEGSGSTAEPKWETASGGAPTVVNITNTGPDIYATDMSFEEIDDAYSKGVVYFNYDGINALVTRVIENSSTSYQAKWLVPAHMNGWILFVLEVKVDSSSVTGTMNSFELTPSP